MSGGDFTKISQIVAFLAVIWFSGRFCRAIHLSPIIGEIAAGIIMGPEVLNVVPDVIEHHSTTDDGHESSSYYESLWQVMGTLGVTLMIAESGTHIHFDKLKKVGGVAFAVGVLGTIVPLVSGMALCYVFQESESDDIWNESFAAGCALAPTSVGIALKLLTEAKQLNSMPGQTIVTAAFLDDVFSIILLVIMEGLGKGSLSAADIVLMFFYCFLFLGLGMLLAVYVFGKFLPFVLNKIPLYKELNYQPRDELHLLIMLGLLVGYGAIGNQIGSHLLGAFIAGMSFSQVSRSMYVWRRQIKRIAAWMVRFFFACTVAFTIPISTLFSLDAFWKGLVFAAIPTVLGKIAAGLSAWKHKWIVGFAMVGRGEFAYLVAQTAKGIGMMSEDTYAIVVWALVLAVIIAPIAFRKVLEREFASQPKSGVKYFIIQAEGHHHTGIHYEIVDVLHNLQLDILEAKVETDGDVDASEFIVGVGGGDDLDEDKIQQIRHDLREAVADPEAQVQLLPVDESDILPLIKQQAEQPSIASIPSIRDTFRGRDPTPGKATTSILSNLDNDHWLEVRFMATHSPFLFPEIVDALEDLGISLVKGHMEDFGKTDSEVMYGRPMHESILSIDITEVKKTLREIFQEHGAHGEVMVKTVRKSGVNIPHHPKFSELLKSGTQAHNPLLNLHGIKLEESCGYEVEVTCERRARLLRLISDALKSLALDIRSMDVEDDFERQKYRALFFVQENVAEAFSAFRRRKAVEKKLTQVFQHENMSAKIKIRAIQMGKETGTPVVGSETPIDFPSMEPQLARAASTKIIPLKGTIGEERPESPRNEAGLPPLPLSQAKIIENTVIVTPQLRGQSGHRQSVVKRSKTRTTVVSALSNDTLAVQESHPQLAQNQNINSSVGFEAESFRSLPPDSYQPAQPGSVDIGMQLHSGVEMGAIEEIQRQQPAFQAIPTATVDETSENRVEPEPFGDGDQRTLSEDAPPPIDTREEVLIDVDNTFQE